MPRYNTNGQGVLQYRYEIGTVLDGSVSCGHHLMSGCTGPTIYVMHAQV